MSGIKFSEGNQLNYRFRENHMHVMHCGMRAREGLHLYEAAHQQKQLGKAIVFCQLSLHAVLPSHIGLIAFVKRFSK